MFRPRAFLSVVLMPPLVKLKYSPLVPNGTWLLHDLTHTLRTCLPALLPLPVKVPVVPGGVHVCCSAVGELQLDLRQARASKSHRPTSSGTSP